MPTAGRAQVKTWPATLAKSPPNGVRAWGPRTIGLSFLVMLAFVAAAAATMPPPTPRLRGLTASGGRIAFIQPDGTPTILELTTGSVVQRGGEPPAGWPVQSQCGLEERKPPTCTFAAGTFRWRVDSRGEGFLEGSTERGSWEAPYHLLTRGNGTQSLGLWAVDEILLFEVPAWSGIAVLGGVDVRSGRGLWVYLYPSYALRSSRGLSSETVRLAREELDQAAFQARNFPTDYVGYSSESFEPRAWTAVLDPDPWQARKVERTSARAWAMLCAAVIASLLSFLTPRGAIRTTFAFAVAGAVGILIAAYGNIDGTLAIRLWIGFLITVWIGAAATSRPRSRNVLWLLVVGTAVLFAFPNLIPFVRWLLSP